MAADSFRTHLVIGLISIILLLVVQCSINKRSKYFISGLNDGDDLQQLMNDKKCFAKPNDSSYLICNFSIDSTKIPVQIRMSLNYKSNFTKLNIIGANEVTFEGIGNYDQAIFNDSDNIKFEDCFTSKGAYQLYFNNSSINEMKCGRSDKIGATDSTIIYMNFENVTEIDITRTNVTNITGNINGKKSYFGTSKFENLDLTVGKEGIINIFNSNITTLNKFNTSSPSSSIIRTRIDNIPPKAVYVASGSELILKDVVFGNLNSKSIIVAGNLIFKFTDLPKNCPKTWLYVENEGSVAFEQERENETVSFIITSMDDNFIIETMDLLYHQFMKPIQDSSTRYIIFMIIIPLLVALLLIALISLSTIIWYQLQRTKSEKKNSCTINLNSPSKDENSEIYENQDDLLMDETISTDRNTNASCEIPNTSLKTQQSNLLNPASQFIPTTTSASTITSSFAPCLPPPPLPSELPLPPKPTILPRLPTFDQVPLLPPLITNISPLHPNAQHSDHSLPAVTFGSPASSFMKLKNNKNIQSPKNETSNVSHEKNLAPVNLITSQKHSPPSTFSSGPVETFIHNHNKELEDSDSDCVEYDEAEEQ